MDPEMDRLCSMQRVCDIRNTYDFFFQKTLKVKKKVDTLMYVE